MSLRAALFQGVGSHPAGVDSANALVSASSIALLARQERLAGKKGGDGNDRSPVVEGGNQEEEKMEAPRLRGSGRSQMQTHSGQGPEALSGGSSSQWRPREPGTGKFSKKAKN